MFERGASSAPRGRVRRAASAGLAQLRAQVLQPRIAPSRSAPGSRGIRVDDEVQLAREVVDDRELLGEQQPDVGQADAGRARASRASFGSM